MSDTTLSALMAHGSQLLLLLERNDLSTAEVQMDHYLGALDSVFQIIPVDSSLNIDQQQALLQFKMIHELVASMTHLAEDELRQFSKAGRAAGLYKLNTG
ncbi:hypothetical protein [Aeromonas enterica]